MALCPKDGGFASRKLWFSVFAIAVITAGALYGSHHAAFSPLYDTMVGGVIGVVAAFLTGNVVGKWVTGKAIVAQSQILGAKEDPVDEDEVEDVTKTP